MPLRFVLDESLRGWLWKALGRYCARVGLPVDAVRVGDVPGLPLGTKDPDLLLWAEREGRLLVSTDRRTMPAHLRAHIEAGHHSAGVILIRPLASLSDHGHRVHRHRRLREHR